MFSFPLVLVAEEVSDAQYLIDKGYQLRSSDTQELLEIIELLEARADLSKEQQDNLRYLKSYYSLMQGDYELALNDLKSLEAATTNNSLKFRAVLTLVNSLALDRKYKEAYTYLNKLESLKETVEDRELIEGGLIVSAYTHNTVKRFQKAKDLSSEVISSTSNLRTKCIASEINIDASLGLDVEEVSFYDLDNAIQVCDAASEGIFKSLLIINKANKLNKQGDFRTALKSLLDIQSLVQSVDYQRLNEEYDFILAETYYFNGNSPLAEKYALKVINDQKSELAEPTVLSLDLLAKIAAEKEDYKQANLYLDSYRHKEKEFLMDLAAKESAFQHAKYELSLKNQTIETLNKENQLLKLEQDLAKKERLNERMVLLLLLFFLASLAFWAYRVKRNQIKLKRQSETDVLTGVCSRHHFYFTCRKTLEYAKANNQEVSFILFDMDRFKSVNDNYGHLVGDWVLKKAIEVARPCWRRNDIVGRLGGEEFAIMLPTCSLEKAVQIAEECRKAIASITTTESGHDFEVSASFGVTTSKISGFDLKELIGDADRIMYQAKSAGKNQVLDIQSRA